MNITVNNLPEQLPENVATVADFLKYKNILAQGTAVAINGHISLHRNWECTSLKEGDALTVISATFGG